MSDASGQGSGARVVLFVGLESLHNRLAAQDPDRITTIQAKDVETALRATSQHAPAVVVVDAAANAGEPIDFASVCRLSQPDFLSPIITVNTLDTEADIVINEWDEKHGNFYERTSPLRFLKNELSSALKLDESDDSAGYDPSDQEAHDELMDLGRNEYIKRGNKMYNIQTEVRVGKTMTIVTQVFDGGAIIDNTVQEVQRGPGDLTKRVGQVAGMQHYEAVTKVRRGRFA